jgi:hypothetical protein
MLISVIPWVGQATDFSRSRPADLAAGSEFLIHLNDPDFLRTKEKKWELRSPGLNKECTLSIRSYFDQDMALKAGDVIYTFEQNNPESYAMYKASLARDQFSLWLTTENKNLPLLLLDCDVDAAFAAVDERTFTLANVAAFIQQPAFFHQPVLVPHPSTSAADMGPLLTTAVVRAPLHFLATALPSGSPGYSLQKFPVIHDGVLKEGPAKDSGPQCIVQYQSPSTSDKAFEVTVPANTTLTVQTLSEVKGFYMMILESSGFQLTVDCYSPADAPYTDFAQIRAQLRSVIDVQ